MIRKWNGQIPHVYVGKVAYLDSDIVIIIVINSTSEFPPTINTHTHTQIHKHLHFQQQGTDMGDYNTSSNPSWYFSVMSDYQILSHSVLHNSLLGCIYRISSALVLVQCALWAPSYLVCHSGRQISVAVTCEERASREALLPAYLWKCYWIHQETRQHYWNIEMRSNWCQYSSGI